jgi:flagellin
MGQVINTNLPSMAAQRALNASQGDVKTSLERLSSGLRINGARDDAAGLAISERFNAQIKGLNQAVRNASDAISLSQTAESALGGTTDLLQRARELAVQSANATNSSTDRAALQAEVTQLVAEIDRIASTTSFNGTRLLDGNFANKQFQVGANANQTVGVTIAGAKSSDLGSANKIAFTDMMSAMTGAAAGTAASGRTAENLTFTVTPLGGTAVNTTVNLSAGESASAIASRISANVDNVTATAKSGARLAYVNTALATDTIEISINGTSLGAIKRGADLQAFGNNVDSAIKSKAALAGLTSTTSANGIDIFDATGADIKVNVGAQTDYVTEDEGVTVTALQASGAVATGALASTVLETNEGTLVSGDLSFTTNETSATTFAVISTNAGAGSILDVANGASRGGEVTASTDKVGTMNISTVTGANTAIQVIDGALATISSTRADLGATQNRFDAIVSGLQVASDNQAAARSRIVDADFAKETATLTRGQILQQAGIAVLAQANAAPQNVLALLQ